MELTRKELAKYIDHTILNPDAKKEDVLKVCQEAREFDVATVCVNASRVALVKEALEGTDVKPIAVIGFPFGAGNTESKVTETKQAIADGAEEIDMVINVGKLHDGDFDYVLADIKAVADACHEEDALLKVIIETSYLSDEEKVKACELSKEAKADFVKTSTGYADGGATEADIALMRETVGEEMGVKASGGIHTYEEALGMIRAGASRIGMSRTVSVLSE